jgi:hypothetical protein
VEALDVIKFFIENSTFFILTEHFLPASGKVVIFNPKPDQSEISADNINLSCAFIPKRTG